MRKFVLLMLLAGCGSCGAVSFDSAHVLVVDAASGKVLLSKEADRAVPIASLTKLLAAMVVLDAEQDPDEELQIEAVDVDPLGRDRGGVPVGAVVSRGALLALALLASDNRAMAALSRAHPGGPRAFDADMQRKIGTLGLRHALIEDPTGLSARDVSSARDMVEILHAAARYPVIAGITSRRSHGVLVNGRLRVAHNTNGLVGAPGWRVLLSKTGYTNDAGRCLGMQTESGGGAVTIVLLGAAKRSQRTRDAQTILRWLEASKRREALP